MSQASSKPFVGKIELSLASKLKEDLIAKGFKMTAPPYTVFSAQGSGVVCTLYESGKVVVQGKEMASFLEFYLEPEILQDFRHSYPTLELDLTSRIGLDESGKGDFFGPLCLAGVYADTTQIEELVKLGVRDSKSFKDTAIGRLAPKIKALCRHEVMAISPQRYNELYINFKNLNQLLAWGHAHLIEKLVQTTGCKRVLLDQFAYDHVMERALKIKKLQIEFSQRHRAEEDPVVAAASILAREAFIRGLAALSDLYSVPLPKGAAGQVVIAARQLIGKCGREALPNVAKMHFKTAESL